MSARMLLLDAGNTRLKWAILEPPHADTTRPAAALRRVVQGAADYAALAALPAAWQAAGPLNVCYGVKVAGDAAAASVQQVLAAIGLVPRWFKATAAACGVNNRYQPAASLGADRWAALLAVRQRTSDAALVVSAGTALTVDALTAEGEFLGGLIVPGLATMRSALAQSTAQLGMLYGKVLAFPDTTADAVESGLVAAAIGAIMTLHSRLEKRTGSAVRVYLTGGDAATLAEHMPLAVSVIAELIFEGIYYMSLEAHPS